MRRIGIGEVYTYERTFDDADVIAFVGVSGDAGRHHTMPGPDEKRLVPGLLTATLPTKIGGDLDYIAREMHFDFARPVYAGDTVRCEMKVTELDEEPDRIRLALIGACTNQRGEQVFRFSTRGIIRRS